eukprot:10922317-Lingulodinium_polyedra.AAC.1
MQYPNSDDAEGNWLGQLAMLTAECVAEIALYPNVQRIIAMAITSPTMHMQLPANARKSLQDYACCPT